MIRTLLIANRGEIAVRIARSAREMGIRTAVVFSEADSGSPHVAAADEAVALAGNSPADTYLDQGAILAAAAKVEADAVHPGYGFLAENAAFASACAEAGLRFVGPTPQVIEAMGYKLEARGVMEEAGIAVVPGSGKLDVDPSTQVEDVGYPLYVKASAGGGGTGMRRVAAESELAAAVAAAQREAQSAFGNDALYLERALEPVRHVEVQIIGDEHGSHATLFERECSVQRRHQKVIEEAPSAAVGDELREQMTGAALAAAKAVGYTNAGTVEFLLTSGGDFYFLEMNTRLQVEHPVTELITGLDLVRLQLLIADGQRLPPEVHAASVSGHAIEARVYAEDPAAEFAPGAGPIHEFEIPTASGIRVDSGTASGMTVSTYYDPLLAKVISHAPTRMEAARALAGTLRRSRIHGPPSNRDFLVRILEDPDFVDAGATTDFIDDRPVLKTPLVSAAARERHAAAAALVGQAIRRETASVQQSIPAGWRNSASQGQSAVFAQPQPISVDYRRRGDGFSVEIDGASAELAGTEVTSQSATIVQGGVARTYDVSVIGPEFFVDGPDGSTQLTEAPRFPRPERGSPAGSLASPMPGKVVRVLVRPGDAVESGQVVAIIEAMKMEHDVKAPVAGRVAELHVGEGDQVEAGQPLARIENVG